MSSFEFDTVKAEKADAIRRINRKRNFSFCLQLVGAFSFLCYFFRWFPTITNTTASTHFSVFNQQLYAFLLMHTIVLFIYQLSTIKKNTTKNQNDTAFEPGLYEEYVSFSTISSSPFPGRESTTTADEHKQLVVRAPLQEMIPISKEDATCRQIACCDDNVVGDYVEKNTNPALNTMVDDCDFAVKRDDKRYRRSRSEKGHRERRSCGRELLRSETVNGRELAVNGGDDDDNNIPGSKSMLEMNNEEFRLTIDRYIASKKKILRDENLALLSVERKEYTACKFEVVS